MLQVRDIHTYYGDSYVLQGVSLDIAPGAVISILGRNGVGKTTLIRSVIGFTPPRAGSILFKGRDISQMPSHERVRCGIGIVPQGRRIFPSLSVRENVEVAQRQPAAEAGRGWTMKAIWELFPPLFQRQSFKGTKLSGGEQQMLATARALVGNHDLLLMDEPSEGLSPLLVKSLQTLTRELKQQGISILLVEQNLSFALPVSDYVYVMNKGQIVYQGPPQEFWGNREVKSQYLGLG